MTTKKLKPKNPYSTRAFYSRWLTRGKSTDVHKDIWKNFIVPIINQMEASGEEGTIENLADIAFGVGCRRIFTCRLKEPLTQFKGYYKRRPKKLWLTAGRRYFKAGTYVMVRLDKRVPTQVEIEFFDKWDTEHTWEFCLTLAEFDYIQSKLELVESREDVVNFSRYRDSLCS